MDSSSREACWSVEIRRNGWPAASGAPSHADRNAARYCCGVMPAVKSMPDWSPPGLIWNTRRSSLSQCVGPSSMYGFGCRNSTISPVHVWPLMTLVMATSRRSSPTPSAGNIAVPVKRTPYSNVMRCRTVRSGTSRCMSIT